MAHKYRIAILLIYHLHTNDINSVPELINRPSQTMIDCVVLLHRDMHLPTARLTLKGKDMCEQELMLTFESHCGYCLTEKAENARTEK